MILCIQSGPGTNGGEHAGWLVPTFCGLWVRIVHTISHHRDHTPTTGVCDGCLSKETPRGRK